MAVAEKIKLAPAPLSEPCRRRSFGVKLDRFKAVVSDIGQKGNIVFLGHGVIYRHKNLVLDIFHGDGVAVVGLFGRLWGQLHPAATHRRLAECSDDISANGTNINFAFEHIGRTVCVYRLVARQKLGHRNRKGCRQRFDEGNVGKSPAGIT